MCKLLEDLFISFRCIFNCFHEYLQKTIQPNPDEASEYDIAQCIVLATSTNLLNCYLLLVLSQNISTICLDKMSHKINLKWHDIKEDMKNTFESLIETSDFVDVSLVCEDGQLVEAHKVIFISFSLFFCCNFSYFYST